MSVFYWFFAVYAALSLTAARLIPRPDYDNLEILERSNFDDSSPAPSYRLIETPKSFANAQVLLRFGNDKPCNCQDTCQCGHCNYPPPPFHYPSYPPAYYPPFYPHAQPPMPPAHPFPPPGAFFQYPNFFNRLHQPPKDQKKVILINGDQETAPLQVNIVQNQDNPGTDNINLSDSKVAVIDVSGDDTIIKVPLTSDANPQPLIFEPSDLNAQTAPQVPDDLNKGQDQISDGIPVAIENQPGTPDDQNIKLPIISKITTTEEESQGEDVAPPSQDTDLPLAIEDLPEAAPVPASPADQNTNPPIVSQITDTDVQDTVAPSPNPDQNTHSNTPEVIPSPDTDLPPAIEDLPDAALVPASPADQDSNPSIVSQITDTETEVQDTAAPSPNPGQDSPPNAPNDTALPEAPVIEDLPDTAANPGSQEGSDLPQILDTEAETQLQDVVNNPDAGLSSSPDQETPLVPDESMEDVAPVFIPNAISKAKHHFNPKPHRVVVRPNPPKSLYGGVDLMNLLSGWQSPRAVFGLPTQPEYICYPSCNCAAPINNSH